MKGEAWKTAARKKEEAELEAAEIKRPSLTLAASRKEDIRGGSRCEMC